MRHEIEEEESTVARIDVLSPDEIADPQLREMMSSALGDEMFGVYGHRPELLKAFMEFYVPAKFGGLLPFSLKELVRLRIAELNDCRR